MSNWQRFCVMAMMLTVAACSGIPGQRDGAPSHAPDMSDIPDAVPRDEPRSQYGNPASYEVLGKRYYVMSSSAGYRERGIASWYGTKFHGRRTSSGETYNMYAMTAAHKTLPLPTYVEVTNLHNGRRVIVKVNDRGPFHDNRLIDLSYSAAKRLGMIGKGTAPVEVRAITPGEQKAPGLSTGTQPVAAGSVSLYLQVGAFSTMHSAQQLKQKIQKQIGDAVIIMPFRKPGRTLYRVRIGPLSTVEYGDTLASRLSSLGFLDAHIVVE